MTLRQPAQARLLTVLSQQMAFSDASDSNMRWGACPLRTPSETMEPIFAIASSEMPLYTLGACRFLMGRASASTQS